MIQEWNIDGKTGDVIFDKGEVVYQTRGVVVEPIYQTKNEERYVLAEQISDSDCVNADGREFVIMSGKNVLVKSTKDKLQMVTTNPFNGYCYRQDGK